MRLRLIITLGQALLGCRLLLLWSIAANLRYLDGISSRMPHDFGVFECILATHSLCTFDIHIAILVTVEALDLVSAEAALLAAHTGHTLHKANHSLLAVRVKATIVARVNVSHQKSLLVLDWISGQCRLGVVSEVSDKTLPVLQFDF